MRWEKRAQITHLPRKVHHERGFLHQMDLCFTGRARLAWGSRVAIGRCQRVSCRHAHTASWFWASAGGSVWELWCGSMRRLPLNGKWGAGRGGEIDCGIGNQRTDLLLCSACAQNRVMQDSASLTLWLKRIIASSSFLVSVRISSFEGKWDYVTALEWDI